MVNGVIWCVRPSPLYFGHMLALYCFPTLPFILDFLRPFWCTLTHLSHYCLLDLEFCNIGVHPYTPYVNPYTPECTSDPITPGMYPYMASACSYTHKVSCKISPWGV